MTPSSTDSGRGARLLAELQHRVRNTLATTRMIARRSAETSESLEEYVAHLDGRLAALARVQNAAIRDPLGSTELGVLVADELTSAGQGAGGQTRVKGPKVPLHARAAEPFALALHEMMTNAIKFGALSVPTGRLAISWAIADNGGGPQNLVFDWVETGMSLGQPANRHEGFGTLVLREMLKHNLGAESAIALPTDGLTCRIRVPLTERILAPATSR